MKLLESEILFGFWRVNFFIPQGPYENFLNCHFYFYVCLFSNTKYTRNHLKVNLGSPGGEDDDEGE